jgi:hypothetical protein
VEVHDEFLDAAPCGYDKTSPDPKRPRWQRGPLQMIGWLVALVYNAVADLASELAGDWQSRAYAYDGQFGLFGEGPFRPIPPADGSHSAAPPYPLPGPSR